MRLAQHCLLYLTLLVPVSALAGERYLCVTDLTSGFDYVKESKKWKPTHRQNAEGKYIVSQGKTEGQWEVTPVGAPISWASCQKGFSSNGELECSGLAEFKMNKNTMRFLYAYLFGYVNHPGYPPPFSPKPYSEGDDEPHIDIGKCSPF